MKKANSNIDPEIQAIQTVYLALRDLDAGAQTRVIDYVAGKLDLELKASKPTTAKVHDSVSTSADHEEAKPQTEIPASEGDDSETNGISPVALKWMRRNDLQAPTLSSIFSLGIDEIDLVAKSVPGDSQREKMRSVFLLKGVAAYLSGGVARFTHQQAKEACLHYDAFDTANFAAYLKKMSTEVSGTKESGYSLTARGLSSATEVVKSLVAAPSAK